MRAGTLSGRLTQARQRRNASGQAARSSCPTGVRSWARRRRASAGLTQHWCKAMMREPVATRQSRRRRQHKCFRSRALLGAATSASAEVPRATRAQRRTPSLWRTTAGRQLPLPVAAPSSTVLASSPRRQRDLAAKRCPHKRKTMTPGRRSTITSRILITMTWTTKWKIKSGVAQRIKLRAKATVRPRTRGRVIRMPRAMAGTRPPPSAEPKEGSLLKWAMKRRMRRRRRRKRKKGRKRTKCWMKRRTCGD
mmetsp:Transcript_89007/g.250656  ORF Transcript_89007/g.250656 Transcript_89007/m.250656 type:complete len:251 (+) Transcript_89007:650-1402(+)